MLPCSCLRLADSKSNSSTRLPRITTTRVSSGWDASISILLVIIESHSDGPAGGRSRRRRRTTGGEEACQMGVEGMGRVFAREFAVDGKMPDFELVWLHHEQHELRPVGARA